MPLWTTTARILQSWFHDPETGNRGTMAFPNARGNALTRDGVQYLLQRAVQRAVGNCSSLADKRIHPHLLRHTCAMHLLQSGVDITIIALWLGHERLQTTHGYVEADLATYRSQFNLPECSTQNGCFQKLNGQGKPGPYPAQDPRRLAMQFCKIFLV